MKIFRGFHHPGIASACAVTIGNFDGVHRGQLYAMLALANEASHRSVDSCVLTSSPTRATTLCRRAEQARSGPLRAHPAPCATSSPSWSAAVPDRGAALGARLAAQSPQAFIDEVLVQGLGARYAVGDDFRFAASARATTPCWTLPDRPTALTWRA